MRVSKISRDTANLVAALASRRRSTRTSSAASSAMLATDLETSSEPTNPRKRKHTFIKVEEELVQTGTVEPEDAPVVQQTSKPKKARRQPAKKIKGEDGGVVFEPPPNWQEMWDVTKEMRDKWPAAVDTMGCESLADVNRSPRDQRFQTLVALMLSSQTKDTVTSVAIKNLQDRLPGGFSVESMREVSPQVLNELINKVGFHNNKTKFIKQAADIICTNYNGDIPDTVEGLMSLPGVGPKMAYLCMSAAWDRHEGIGVDVHVHRITNLWGWHKTNTPEQTREQLEAWLPKDRWHAINHLLVGFGQTWCPPVGRKCADCALAQKSLCPSAVIAHSSPRKIKKEAVKLEVSTDSDSVSTHEVATQELTHVKSEDMETSISMPGLQDIEDIASWPRRTRSRGIKVER